MTARDNLGLYRKEVLGFLDCVYDYSSEYNTTTADGQTVYFVGEMSGDERTYYLTDASGEVHAVTFERCDSSSYCYKGEVTVMGDDIVVYLTLKAGTWDGITFPYDGVGAYATAPHYSYDVYIARIEDALTYPVPEEYIPDTIARKSDIPEAGGSGETSRIFNFRDIADITIENMQVGPGEYADVEVFKLNVAKIPLSGGLMIKDAEVAKEVVFCDPDGNEITEVIGSSKFDSYVGAMIVSARKNNLGYYEVVFGRPDGYIAINGLDGSYSVVHRAYAFNS